jgi:hypothetical protein
VYPVLFITVFEDMKVSFSARQLGWMLCAVGLLNTLLWLDALDNYLDARFQWSLSSDLPVDWYEPSRRLAEGVGNLASQIGRQAKEVTQTVQEIPATSAKPAPPAMQLAVQALPAGAFLPSLAVQQLSAGPQRILFAGDSMMQGIAPLVIRDLSLKHPDWQMTDLSKQSTGLTSRKYFDWPRTIQQEIQAQNLSLVVIFLGPNDPRDMYLPDKRVSFGKPEWLENYAARVDEILANAVQNQVRVIWLGLPAMREEPLHRGAMVSNHVFHDRAQAFGTDYLATEPLIGLVSLPFKKFMRNENGLSVNLRGEDGTHFTPAGLHKIKQALVEHIEKAQPQ